MSKYNLNNLTYLFSIVLTMMVGIIDGNSQNVSIVGLPTANFGETKHYTLNDPNSQIDMAFPPKWTTNGTLMSQSQDVLYADVLWNTVSGSNSEVEFKYYDSMDVLWSTKFTVNVSNLPSTPVPTLSAVMQPTCSTALGSFTITNYDASYSYTATPSLGVTFTGAVVTAPEGSYTITATSGGVSSPVSETRVINGQPSCLGLSNENYVHTIAPRIRTTDIASLTTIQKTESVNYFDGLGRPIQSIGINAGGNEEDIITHIDYDEYGRQDKEYLPYALNGNKGLYRTDALISTSNFYNTAKYENTPNPYSEKHFENSPLSRVFEQGAPGVDWGLDKVNDTDHTIKFDYLTNTDADYVRNFAVSFVGGNTEAPQLKDNGLYPASVLYKTIIKDENWQPNQINPSDHTTEEYKDKQGRVLLKRTYNKGLWHDTYYVYDDYGNLTYVLPPKVRNYGSIVQAYKDLKVNMKVVDNPNLGYYYSNNMQGEGFFNASTYNGTVLNIFIGETNAPNSALKTGKVLDLDFITPQLPDMSLGNVYYDEFVNQSPVIVGTAHILNGGLYFNSNGTVLSNYGDLYCSGNLTQSTFPLNTVSQSDLDNLCYQYKYDNRNRLIKKKIPGKDWEYIVYDNLDRPVMTQDANLRAANNSNLTTDQWLYTKYDTFGRIAYTGIYTSNETQAQLQAIFNNKLPHRNYEDIDMAGVNNLFYEDVDFPNTNTEVLTVNYYDNYNAQFATHQSPVSFGVTSIDYPKGLLTHNRVKILGAANDWITTHTYYDDKGRIIYVKSINDYLGTTDIVENELDFVGKPLKTKKSHTRNSTTITTLENYTYDHVGRLITQTQCIGDETMGYVCPSSSATVANLALTGTINTDQVASNSITITNGTILPNTRLWISPEQQEMIVNNTYDDLGQLESKGVGGKMSNSNRLQIVDYTYNIRGWLKQINNPTTLGTDLFAFKIGYNEGTNALYNGNIALTQWKTANTDSGLKNYNYQYDALNRITTANSHNGYFTLSNIVYDKNGNILGLRRTGKNHATNNTYGNIDNLTYGYETNSNKLKSVTDSYGLSYAGSEGFKDGNTLGDDYRYDKNGNMVMDLNKGIGTTTTDGITYNHLNLPTLVNINDGGSNNGTISYIYDATGVKLKKVVSTGTTTEYAGNYVYENSSLKFFNHPEGYVDVNGSSYNYVYQYKDHLGNVRLSYMDSNNSGNVTSSEILEENNYYPFGLKHKGYNTVVNSTNPALKYKYNGKELNEEFGLDLYDYGARNYDAVLGRFMNIDPLAEISFEYSPFNYVKNNPLNLVDPTGMIWKDPKEAEKLKDKARDRKKSIAKSKVRDQERLKDISISDRKKNRIEKRIKDYDSRTKSLNNTIKNIDALGADKDHTFDLVSGSDGKNHVVMGEDGVINIQGPNDALKIHELTHAAVSLKNPKGLRFDKNGKLLANYPGGLLDEILGYSAQYGFDPSSLPSSASSMDEIDMVFLASIKDDNNRPVYKVLYNKYREQINARRKKQREEKRQVRQEKNKTN
ncbi:DUF6443 domain-containing protein [Flavivirga eckloniae]|uniref:DUF6443 domain-containing protein n=1 Tax=Flavivirga eckloniae TaxID=1803846 RepID=A0A2K9PKP8_9FLAO|nr:DUF6443 domain-containing protein [Flavivirga eckloniae]AUP77428.1 hypothetical protein C1H87_01310 [Flavivirga eckloniae]